MFRELVVVCAELTATSPPTMLRSPAEFTPPDTVVFPEELEISTTPRDVIGAALVIVEALEILTAPALIAPVPVLTVEDAPVLEIVTPWAAVIVGELVVV